MNDFSRIVHQHRVTLQAQADLSADQAGACAREELFGRRRKANILE